MTSTKPYDIAKRTIWEAYQRVKANRGAAGIDDETIAMFEQDLSKNLYKLWNRMSSGSYFPPPVRQVEIPKATGGIRKLGKMSNLPAFVAPYTPASRANPVSPAWHDIDGFRVKRVWPKPEAKWRTLSPGEWANALVQTPDWQLQRFSSIGGKCQQFPQQSGSACQCAVARLAFPPPC
jgi:hypothetical protein